MDKSKPLIHAAIGILQDPNGKILVALRPNHVSYSGFWEFPGGKVEQGETTLEALSRELCEEIGITVKQAHRLSTLNHDNEDRMLILETWKVDEFTGTPTGKEGQIIEWITTEELHDRKFLPANKAIVKLLTMPPLKKGAAERSEAGDLIISKIPPHYVRPPFSKGVKMPCFIIAEAGVNHNGSLELALNLIDAAAAAGANAIKFQSFHAETLVTPYADTAHYQKQTTGQTSQFEMLKSLELPKEFHPRLIEHCQAKNIEFMSTGFDIGMIDFLCNLGMQRIKIPSGEITHSTLLAHAAAKNLPMILSTGMSTLEEIAEAIEIITDTRKQFGFQEPLAERLTLLHCTSNYPTALSDTHLNAMQTLSQTFKLPTGYSDHTPGLTVPPLAVAMGACVIEKHFTLDQTLPGPDHLASITPHELTQMVQLIRQTEMILGNPTKAPCKNELPIRDLVRRSITLKSNKPAETPLTPDDLILLRPGNGIAPQHLSKIIGKQLKKDLLAGTTLQWEDLI